MVSRRETNVVSRRERSVVSRRETNVVSRRETKVVSRRETNVGSRRETNVVSRRETNVVSQRETIVVSRRETNVVSRRETNVVADAQEELLNISEWLRVNKLSPNPSKTEYLIIGHPRKTKDVNIPNGLKLNDSEIKRVSKTKSLGVMVDENLKWDEQFKTVKNKICGGLASLKKLKNILPQSKLCSVYYAIVESHLRYADVI